MRTIKFRAWDRKNDEMKDWDYVRTNWTLGILNGDSRTEIMQFTGLKDKNGKEIYEGDVVRWTSWKLGSRMASPNTYKVEAVQWNSEGYWCVPSSTFHFGIYSDVEVIGNIYENPELLKP